MKTFVAFIATIAIAIIIPQLSFASSSTSSSSSSSNANSNQASNPPQPNPPSKSSPDHRTQLTIGDAIFSTGINLYTASIAGQSGSLVISPISIETCLSVLYCGAGGSTAAALQSALQLQGYNQTAVAQSYQQLLKPLQQSNLDIATGVFVRNSYHLNNEFQATAQNDFYSLVETLDFNDAEETSNTINNWVSQKTDGKITKLLSPNAITSGSQMFVMNAIYFKGVWSTEFSPSLTVPQPFYTSGSCSSSAIAKQLPTMHLSGQFNVGDVPDLNAAVLQLSYTSGAQMTIILPNDCNGLSAVEAALPKYNFNHLNWYVGQQQADLAIPKFTTTFSIDLNRPLVSLGLGNIFSPSANFNQILESYSNEVVPLQVSSAIQQAILEVDEQGAEGAAGTGFNGFTPPMPGLPPPPPFQFIANHPFVYYIQQNDEILFMGRYTGS